MKPLFYAVLAVVLATCSSPSPSIVGTWRSATPIRADLMSPPVSYTFAADGSGSYMHHDTCFDCGKALPDKKEPIRWSVDGNRLRIIEGSRGGDMTFEIKDNELQLSPAFASAGGAAVGSGAVYIYVRQ